MTSLAAQRPQRPSTSRRPGLASGMREAGVLGLLFLFYKAVRYVAAQHVARAFSDAGKLLALEHWLHLPTEASLQHALVARPDLARAANLYYASVHFPLTIATLLWCWWRRPLVYRWLRNNIVLLTAAGLALHVAIPVAPPRLLPDLGFVDVAARYGPSVYGPPASNAIADQYAALPSLHVGWAILVAAAFVLAMRSRWRWLWFAHPLFTVYVVVATGNHYWIDGLVVTLMLGIVALITRWLDTFCRHREHSRCARKDTRFKKRPYAHGGLSVRAATDGPHATATSLQRRLGAALWQREPARRGYRQMPINARDSPLGPTR